VPFPSRAHIALLIVSLPAIAGSPVPGIQRFVQVDEHVYRGGQPANEGYRYLAEIGVKSVIDLREGGPRATAEERVVKAAGMRYIHVPMSGLTPPTEAQIRKVLAILEDAASGPVFVHCKRGADRTGSVIAAYRIEHDKWDNARALKEAMSLGMSWFQLPRQRYIKNFEPRTVDADATAPATTRN